MDGKANKPSISKTVISKEEGCYENQPNLYAVGCLVKHPTWGVGVIRDCFGKKGDVKIIVDFQDIGPKKLAAKFANLENITTINSIVRADDHFEKSALEESTFEELKESEEPLSEKLNGLKGFTFDERLTNMPIEKLGLTKRIFNALKRAGCRTTRDIVDILQRNKIANIGRMSTIDIKNIKNAIGMIQTYSQPVNEISADIVHKDRHFETPALKEPTFEESVKASFDENSLNTLIEELDLTVRAFNVLKRNDFKTIGNIMDFGFAALLRKTKLGRKSIANIKHAILMVKTQTQSINEISFSESIEHILASINPKHLYIVKSRYGYDQGKRKTLEEIGNKAGITRERVRQILKRAITQIKHPIKRNVLQAIMENVERMLLQYKGIVSVNDIAKDKYFATGTHTQLRFLINLFVELYPERYRFIDKFFLTSIDDTEIQLLHSKIREVASKCQFPINEETLIENIKSSVGPISEGYIACHLLFKEHIVVLEGKVLSSGRLSVPDRVKLLLKDIDKPMHFTEIARLIFPRFFGHSNKLGCHSLQLK